MVYSKDVTRPAIEIGSSPYYAIGPVRIGIKNRPQKTNEQVLLLRSSLDSSGSTSTEVRSEGIMEKLTILSRAIRGVP